MTTNNLGGAGIGPNQAAFVEQGTYEPVVVFNEDARLLSKPLTSLELFWIRFRSNRAAIGGLIVVGLMVLMAIMAPLLTRGESPLDYHIELGFGGHPPSLVDFPSRIFGTTGNLNRSIWVQIVYGARISLFIGVVASLFTTIIGTIFGAIAGYFGGWVDNLIMRITDIFLTIPFLPLAIAISVIFFDGHESSPWFLIGIFAFFGWPGVARLVRSSFLSLRTMEFVESARAAGVNPFRIIFRHILPNALSPIIVVTTLGVAGNIVGESTLDFLGVGLSFPPTATWGNTLAGAQADLTIGDWWWPLFPGLFLIITVLAVNFIGDGLRDAIDVRTNLD